jgi:hypothetical protein
MVALNAIEIVAARERERAQRANDQGLLALLTREQRRCIEAYLQGEAVSQARAIEAWAKESPRDQVRPPEHIAAFRWASLRSTSLAPRQRSTSSSG